MPTKKALQAQCKAAGISRKGRSSKLAQRLWNHRHCEQSSSPEQEDKKCDAILVTRSMVGSGKQMKRAAKTAFRKVLQEEELKVVRESGEIYVGNTRGLGFGERFRILEGKISELDNSVSILKLAGEDYKRVRRRFISTFVRDKLRNAKQSDHNIIKEVSLVVHGGDASVDALLCDDIEGLDDIFGKLYGIHPSYVKEICK